MKATRRHELQENVLSADLAQIVSFLRKRGTIILVGLLVAALIAVVAAYAYGNARDKKLRRQGDFDKAMTNTSLAPKERVDMLEQLASQGDDELIASRSLIALADEYARRIILTDRTADPAQWQKLMDTATAYYRKVISDHAARKLSVAEAHFGLGGLAENRDDLAGAKKEYQAVLAMGLAGQPVTWRAEQALKKLDWLAEPVRMATTAPAKPQTQPATKPATTKPIATSAPANQPGR